MQIKVIDGKENKGRYTTLSQGFTTYLLEDGTDLRHHIQNLFGHDSSATTGMIYPHHYQGFQPNKKSARQAKYFIETELLKQIILHLKRSLNYKPNKMNEILHQKISLFTKTVINQTLNPYN